MDKQETRDGEGRVLRVSDWFPPRGTDGVKTEGRPFRWSDLKPELNPLSHFSLRVVLTSFLFRIQRGSRDPTAYGKSVQGTETSFLPRPSSLSLNTKLYRDTHTRTHTRTHVHLVDRGPGVTDRRQEQETSRNVGYVRGRDRPAGTGTRGVDRPQSETMLHL